MTADLRAATVRFVREAKDVNWSRWAVRVAVAERDPTGGRKSQTTVCRLVPLGSLPFAFGQLAAIQRSGDTSLVYCYLCRTAADSAHHRSLFAVARSPGSEAAADAWTALANRGTA